MSKPETVKLQKGQQLHFVSRDEKEEIIKSSNNRESGMIRTYSSKKRKNKEYTVNFVLNLIEDGTIRLISIETVE